MNSNAIPIASITTCMTNNVKKIAPVLFIFVISFWPLYVSVFSGTSIMTFDSITHFLPLRFNAIQTIMDGQLPLWNPHIFSGMTLIGDGLSNPFDPLNAVFIIFDPIMASIILLCFQLFLAGFFMFLYLKKSLGFSQLSSWLGGMLYVFNPTLICGVGQRLDFINPFCSSLWLPLVLLFLDRAIEGKSRHSNTYALLAGLTLALAVFGGSINIVFFMACFVTLYLFLSPVGLRKKINILLIIGVFSFAITAVQLLPMMENAGQAQRAMLWPNYQYDLTCPSIAALVLAVINYPLDLFLNKPRGFVDLASLTLNQGVMFFYLGIADLIFLILAFYFKAETFKIRNVKIGVLAILFLLIAGHYMPLQGAFHSLLPLLKGIRLGYISFLLYFCLIVLIIRGFDLLIRGQKISIQVCRWSRRAIFLFAGVFLSLFVWRHYPALSSLFFVPLDLDKVCLWLRPVAFTIVLVLIFYVLSRMIGGDKTIRQRMGLLLVVLMTSNMLLLWEFEYIKLVKSPLLHQHFEESREVAFFKTMAPYERFEIMHEHKHYWGNLPYGFNFPLFYGASISGGSHQLMSYRHRKFFDMLNLRYPFDPSYYWKDGKYIYPSAYAYIDNKEINRQSLNLLGVKYLFFRGKQDKPYLKELTKGNSYYIYENLEALPRCFIVHDYRILGEEEILNQLSQATFDAREIVLIEKKLESNRNVPHQSSSANFVAKSDIISYTANDITIRAFSPENGILVLTDSYDKGWKVSVNGAETKLYRANYLFRAVQIPAGEHIVRFRYMPVSFIIGLCITLCAVFGGLVFYFCNRRSVGGGSCV